MILYFWQHKNIWNNFSLRYIFKDFYRIWNIKWTNSNFGWNVATYQAGLYLKQNSSFLQDDIFIDLNVS